MKAPVVERRLAAILAADMVGYSRLMEADEDGTLARLQHAPAGADRSRHRQEQGPDHQDHRRRHAGRVPERHRGRAVRGRGPGAHGPAQRRRGAGALDPVPHRHQSRRRDRRGRRHLRRRRQHRRAPRGAGRARRHLRLRRPCATRSATGSSSPSTISASRRSRTSPGRSASIAVVLDGDGAAAARRTPPPPVAAAKPSIAVLPFANMSGDPEQEFFADGLTEDIITELSRFRDLFVISRNSAFVYKGKPVRVPGGGARVRRPVRGRGQRAQGRQPGARHRAADRRRDRPPRLGRALRPRARRHLRHPGRDHRRDRRHPARPGRGRQPRARQPQAHGQHGGLRVRAGRQGAAPPLDARPTMPRRSACSTAPSPSTRTMPTPMPGRPACSARPGSNDWCEDRDATWERVLAELGIALALDDNDSDVHRILAAVSA